MKTNEYSLKKYVVDYRNTPYLLENGVSFHWWNQKTTSLHSHNHYEIFIITEGEAIHKFNGEIFKLKKGALHFIKPNDTHKLTAENGGYTHMNIAITKEKLETVLKAFDVNLEEFETYNPLINLDLEEFDFFNQKAERLGMLKASGINNVNIIIYSMVSEAISLIIQNNKYNVSNIPLWFRQILEKLHSPEYLAASAKDVYKLGSFSPPAMIEYFKEYTGMGVREYLINIKIKYAKSALKHLDIKIIDLSNDLGYQSLSHFNRVFKENTGISPALYRKKHQNE